ncbi:hypothetical protein ACLB2K_070605 [Fragaria x ananassa]
MNSLLIGAQNYSQLLIGSAESNLEDGQRNGIKSQDLFGERKWIKEWIRYGKLTREWRNGDRDVRKTHRRRVT